MTVTAVILAAGKGTRMRSEIPKVLHPILDKPMIYYALQAALEATDSPPVLVIGHQADRVKEALGSERIHYALQEQQLGTGHAVQQAQELLRGGSELVLVTYGDMPAVRSETLQGLIETQRANDQGPVSMLTVTVDDPRGFGRVVRNAEGQISAVVEEADAEPQQLDIKELNAGMYCFQGDWLWDALSELEVSPQGEYYLTDLIAQAFQEGLQVGSMSIQDQEELIGVNNRIHLSEAGKIIQQRINHQWMLSGVSIPDPATVYISPEVDLGQDSVILPNTHLMGSTSVGERCQIGPDSQIYSSTIGSDCQVFSSVVEFARMDDGSDIGPYSHLRKGAHLAEDVHIGNFGEVKDSYLGKGTKMGHFSYLGNAQIGRNVNIGAGTITCNYDGKEKHTTIIEDGVFIGSDTMLIAPVKIGQQARTGAGSVVTKDIPSGMLAVGVPARIRKLRPTDKTSDK